jgi:hypothetical protein
MGQQPSFDHLVGTGHYATRWGHAPHLAQWKGVSDSGACETHIAGGVLDACLQSANRFVGSDLHNACAGYDLVAYPDRFYKSPLDFKKYGPGTRQILRHQCIEESRGDASLNDYAAYCRFGCYRLVVVQRIPIACDLRESNDVIRAGLSPTLRDLADGRLTAYSSCPPA